eukprot:3334418-Karenia_brevis.AAC.1
MKEECRTRLLFHGTKVPRPVPQPPPWMEPRNKAGGKALGVLRQNGLSDPVSIVWGDPWAVYKMHPQTGRPVCLASWKEVDGCKVHEENIKLFNPDLTAGSLYRALQ